MINTVLFDLDGTILDTHELIFETFKRTFETIAPHIDTDTLDYHSFIGPPIDIMFAKYLKDHQIEEAIKIFRHHNLSLHEQYVTVYPNIREVLKRLKADNFNIGIVSSKIKSSINYGLNLFDLTEYFDFIVGYDDVSSPKPDPQGILKALNHFNVRSEQAIMIGDAISDIEAAKFANCKSAMVTYSLLDNNLIQQANADYYLDDMLDLLKHIGGNRNGENI